MFLNFYYNLQVLTFILGGIKGESFSNSKNENFVGLNDIQQNSDGSRDDSENFQYKRVPLQNNYQSYDPFNSKTVQDKNSEFSDNEANFPYGIVYNNGKPLGILEPFPREYRESNNNFEKFNDQSGNHISENEISVSKNSNSKMYNLKRGTEDSKETDGKNHEKREAENGIENTNEIQKQQTEIKANKNVLSKRSSQVEDFSFLENSKKDLTSEKKEDNEDSKDKRSPFCCPNNNCNNDKENKGNERKNEKDTVEDKDNQIKRLISVNENDIEKLKSTLNELRNPSPVKNVESLERNLRSLLVEMGLAESDKQNEKSESSETEVDSPIKRSIFNEEDENMEGKINNIEINEVEKMNNHDNERRKRQGEKETQNEIKTVDTVNKHLVKKEAENHAGNSKKKYKSNEKYRNNLRLKRAGEKTEAAEIIKDSESDFTVTGNKTPLVSSSGTLDTSLKQNISPSALNGKNNNAELDYQERIERNIQSKIDAIKEEVRREIESLKIKEKRSAAPYSQDSSRKKRNVNLDLTDEETPEISPELDLDSPLKPLIRRRRNTSKSKDLLQKNKRNLEKTSEKTGSENQQKIEKNSNEKLINSKLMSQGSLKGNDKEQSDSSKQQRDVPDDHKKIISSAVEQQNEKNSSPEVKIHSYNENNNIKFQPKIANSKLRRKKRDIYEYDREYVPEEYYYRRRKRGHSGYLPYQDEEYEMENEGDELEDEGYYGQNRQRKRQTEYENDENLDLMMDGSMTGYGDGYRRNKRFSKKHRRINEELRIKRDKDYKSNKNSDGGQQISDLTDTEIFGALPQNYDGELTRFKRVKRNQKNS